MTLSTAGEYEFQVTVSDGNASANATATVTVLEDGIGQTAGGTTQIDSCRAIETPGHYELSGDIDDNQADACLHVRSDDVVIDGNGHVVTGAGREGTNGIWAFNGTLDEHTGEELQNVTIRNVRLTNWGTGIQVGEMNPEAGPQGVRIENVTTRDNGQGITVRSASGTLVGVTSSNNDADGINTVEVADVDIRDVVVRGNGDDGIGLHQETHDTTVENANSTANGAAGIRLGTAGVRGNVVRDSHVADNGGPGVRIASDVSNNTLTGSVVENNTGVGVEVALAASETTLADTVIRNNDGGGLTVSEASGHARNVTLVGNGGVAYRGIEDADEFTAEGIRVGPSATVSFDAGTLNVTPASAVTVDDTSATVVGDALDVSGVTASTALRVWLAYDPATVADVGGDESSATLQRHDGTRWHQVSNASVDVDSRTVSGTVRGSGTVAPVVNTTGARTPDPATPTTAGSPATPTTNDGSPVTVPPTIETPTAEPETPPSPPTTGASVFKVLATSSGEVSYRFVVDGPVSKLRAEDGTAADADDRVVANGDGTTTVIGSTGDNAGDAYSISGEVTSFETTDGESGVDLRLDGEDVTDELIEENQPDEDGSTTSAGGAIGESIFKVMSTTEGAEFTYRFTVDGDVTKTKAADGTAADDEERIADTGDGTVTVTGSTGDGFGDAFVVRGEVVSFEKTGGESGFALYRDGVDVTDEYT